MEPRARGEQLRLGRTNGSGYVRRAGVARLSLTLHIGYDTVKHRKFSLSITSDHQNIIDRTDAVRHPRACTQPRGRMAASGQRRPKPPPLDLDAHGSGSSLAVPSSRGGAYQRLEENEEDSAATVVDDAARTIMKVSQLQHFFRRQRFLYRHFGPLIFCKANAQPADYGRIIFGRSRVAEWITVADTTSVNLLARFLEKRWQLPRPQLLLSIIGGTELENLTPRMRLVLDSGLASLAETTQLWILTDGLDRGAASLVGASVNFSSLRSKVPVIGIASLAAVRGAALLDGRKGHTVQYRPRRFVDDAVRLGAAAPLNAQHSHLVAVDAAAAVDDVFVAGTRFRARLEAVFQARAPLVQLLLGGGLAALATTLETLRRGTPVLVVSDSGGAATALHEHCHPPLSKLAEDAAQRRSSSAGALGPAIAARRRTTVEGAIAAVKGEVAERERSLLEAIAAEDERSGKRLLSYFSLSEQARGAHGAHGGEGDDADDDAAPGLGTALLGGIVRALQAETVDEAASLRGQPPLRAQLSQRAQLQQQRALVLCVQWDSPDLAQKILLRADEPCWNVRMGVVLQRALELQRVSLVKILSELPGFTAEGVNLCILYGLDEKAFNFFADDGLQSRLNARLHEIHGADGSRYELYKEVVGPFLAAASPMLGRLLEERAVSHIDHVFLWCVLIGNQELMSELWGFCRFPMRMLLLGSAVCLALGGSSLALELEQWAVGVIELISSRDDAAAALSQRLPDWPQQETLLEVAIHLGSKRFLGHRHCQLLVDCWWKGVSADPRDRTTPPPPSVTPPDPLLAGSARAQPAHAVPAGLPRLAAATVRAHDGIRDRPHGISLRLRAASAALTAQAAALLVDWRVGGHAERGERVARAGRGVRRDGGRAQALGEGEASLRAQARQLDAAPRRCAPRGPRVAQGGEADDARRAGHRAEAAAPRLARGPCRRGAGAL